jgi:signal transduction histidine kinase
MKKPLNKLIYRSYLSSSLIPVLTVEVLLLVLYFGISTFITSKTMNLLLEEAKENLGEISSREAQKIDQELHEISTLARYMQNEQQYFFTNPDVYILPNGEPEFAVAANGVFYKKNNNGGSSLYYSSRTRITAKEHEKARRTETFDPLLKNIVTHNPKVVAAYFNSYDNMNRLYPFIPEVANQYGEHIRMEDFNFYYEADASRNPTRQPVWTDAYLDPAGNGWMVSCIVPIYNGNFLEGVSGIDVTIANIIDKILKLDLPWQGNAFLVSNDGMIIALPEKVENYLNLKELKSHVYHTHLTTTVPKPEEFNLLKNNDSAIVAQIRQLFTGKSSLINFQIQEQEFLLQQEIIPSTQWRLLFLVDKDAIFIPIYQLKTLSIHIGILVIILMILFYLAFFLYLVRKSATFAEKIAEPIVKLTEMTSAVSDNINGTLAIKSLNSQVIEVDQLEHNFRLMVTRLQDLFKSLREAHDTLEHKVQERTEALSKALEHLKTAQEELVQSEKMAALGQLVAGIAHEINTPLGVIRASIDNIKRGLNTSIYQLPSMLKMLPENQQNSLFTLIEQAMQVKKLSTREERQLRKTLIAQLQTWEVADAEQLGSTLINMGFHVAIEPYKELFLNTNIANLLKVAHSLVRQQNNSNNIELAVEKASKIIFALKTYAYFDHKGTVVETDIVNNLEIVLTLYYNQLKQGIELIKNYDNVPHIFCNPDELNQVWVNLLHNAIHAMATKGRLELEVKQEGNYVVVYITDSGHGIPPEIKTRIFEPFFTTKPLGEGNGLGLDIVRKIVEKHYGRIEFTSQPGRTTFMVFLPITKGDEV